MKMKPVVLYLLLFLVAVFVFAFLLFPEKQLAMNLSRSLTMPDSTVQISIDRVKPVIPFKLNLENLRLLIAQTTEIIPESFVVNLNPVFLFDSKKSIKFQSDLYQGSVRGRLRLNQFDPPELSQASLFMSGVKMSDFRYKTTLADITINCELNGEYKYLEAKAKKGTGQGTLSIRDFSAKMGDSFFTVLNLPVLDFSDIELEFMQNLNTFMVKKCIAKGSIINVDLKGRVEILSHIQNARLNLTGVILPDSPYLAKFANVATIKSRVNNISKKGIRFKINGTLGNPRVGI